MTKGELLEQIKDMPDDATISIILCYDDKDSVFVNDPYVAEVDPPDGEEYTGHITLSNKIGAETKCEDMSAIVRLSLRDEMMKRIEDKLKW